MFSIYDVDVTCEFVESFASVSDVWKETRVIRLSFLISKGEHETMETTFSINGKLFRNACIIFLSLQQIILMVFTETNE